MKSLSLVLGLYKAYGPVEVSLYALKECTETLDRPLGMFKLSLEEDVYSAREVGERTNVETIFKKGDRKIAGKGCHTG